MELSDSDELKSSSEEEDSDFDSDDIEREERKRKQTAKKVCIMYFPDTLFKVHIFWEGHKILQNLYLTCVLVCT